MRFYHKHGHFFMEDKLRKQMQSISVEELKRKDNNKIIIVVGDTGIGKSAFTNQLAAVADPNFSLENIQFTTEEMKNALKTMRNRVIIFDEAFRGASGRSVMGKQQKELLQMLYEIRQLNQLVFLVAPSFFRLDEAIAVELSDALFHISKTGKGRRAFRMFNRKKKDKLYYAGKRGKKSYTLVPSMFNGVFPDTYVVDTDDYRKKKFDSLYSNDSVSKVLSKTEEKFRSQRDNVVSYVHNQEKSYRTTQKTLKNMGMPLSLSRIHEITTPNP